MTNQLAERRTEENTPLKALLSQENIKKRFAEVLGPRRGAQFISSLVSVWNASKKLQECTPSSILGAAAQAAALDLSIVPTIGHAAIVPYKDTATFQIMSRGIVQLAHRSSKYKTMNLAEVYEGQLVSEDRFSGRVTLDEKKRKSDLIEGFFFVFELLNGYRHEAYWSARRCVEHGWKYSKSFQYGSGLWVEDQLLPMKGGKFDKAAFKGFLTFGSGTYAMASKTVIKNTLSKWGPLSADMMDAFTADQSSITPDGKKTYIDAVDSPEMDTAGMEPIRKGRKPKKDDAKAETPETDAGLQYTPAGTIVRIARTENLGKPVDVVTFDVGGKESRFYVSNEDVTKALKAYHGKDHAVILGYEKLDDVLWVLEFKEAKNS